MVKSSKCVLCGHEGKMKVKLVMNSRDILICPNCKLQITDPFPTDEELNKIYDDNYFINWFGKSESSELKSMKNKSFIRIFNSIKSYINHGNILDIGAATGFLLETAKLLGFNCYGIELSEYASSIAKNKIGEERIYNGYLENYNINHNFFDIITMCDLIEHITDPIKYFTISNKLLKKTYDGDSYILVTTPNTRSLTSKLFGKKWHRYIPEHLIYFNNSNMKKLGSLTGFELISVKGYAKVINFSYLLTVYKKYEKYTPYIIYEILNLFNKISLINKVDFPLLMGESVYLFKKVKDL